MHIILGCIGTHVYDVAERHVKRGGEGERREGREGNEREGNEREGNEREGNEREGNEREGNEREGNGELALFIYREVA